MLDDEAWDAVTMLDHEEARTDEIAPGSRVQIRRLTLRLRSKRP
jgi:hypothetical protein